MIVSLQDLYHFRDSQGAKRGEGSEHSGSILGSAGAEVHPLGLVGGGGVGLELRLELELVPGAGIVDKPLVL